MNRIIVNRYIELMKKNEGYRAFETYLLFNIAPLIEKVKPASLVRITDRNDFLSFWNEMKSSMRIEDVEFMELKTHCNAKVVIFYNKELLREYFSQRSVRNFLVDYGYDQFQNIDLMLERLKSRFESSCPHEIGIFLGYPVEDTIEFIKNHGKNCLLCGYWKVYKNKAFAESIFEKYDEAKNKILHQLCEKTIRIKTIDL